MRPIAATLAALALLLSSCAGGAGPGPDGGAAIPTRGGELAAWSGVTGPDPRAGASPAFWDHWGDGRAELSSYRVVTPRYGEPREGELVLIYVTEPHDRRTWIKDDDAVAPHRVEVLKLNASLKFLTGIYPYSVMTGVFSPVADWGGERFRPVKITTTVQEWCGQTLHQVWPGTGGLRRLRISYFAGEGERADQVEAPPGTLYEDALLIQLRELDGPFADGGDWEGALVPSLWDARRGHGEAAPVRATLERTEATLDGTPVTRFVLRYDGVERTIDVERAHPRRILGWRDQRGDTVRLVETRRLPYWRLNGPEGARYRTDLGLDPASSGRPPSPPPGGEGP